MKRSGLVALVAVALLCAAVTPVWAWGGHGFHHHPGFHTRVFFGVGPLWWGPGWYYPPPYVYGPPVVVQQEPQVYVESPAPPPAPPAPPASSGPAYWYYCQSANGYYPSVPSCPEAWIQVAPRTP